ncbi:MAG: ankyrin repeat domain-containing protein [Opitutaceae bacterium]
MNQTDAFAILGALATRHLAPESLTAAAADGNLDAIHAFLEAGANLEEKSVGFSSPLHAAVTSGRAASVELLLAKGASVEKKHDAMYSPISATTTWGYTDLFHRLVALARNTSGERAALITLASYGQLAELRLLMDKGAAPDGRYAVAAAAKNGHYEVVKYLIDAGVEWKEFVALRIPQGARDAGFTELFNYLSGEIYDAAAALAIGLAAKEKRLSALAAQMAAIALKRKPADPAERKTLLAAAHEAIATGALRQVLDRPVIPADKIGKVTPLIAGSLAGDPALVSALLAAGAKPALKLKDGLTAKGVARGPARDAIITLLEQAARSGKPRSTPRPADAKPPKQKP